MAPTEVPRREFLLQRHFDCVVVVSSGFVYCRSDRRQAFGKALSRQEGREFMVGTLTDCLAAICPSCGLSQFPSSVVVQGVISCLSVRAQRDGQRVCLFDIAKCTVIDLWEIVEECLSKLVVLSLPFKGCQGGRLCSKPRVTRSCASSLLSSRSECNSVRGSVVSGIGRDGRSEEAK